MVLSGIAEAFSEETEFGLSGAFLTIDEETCGYYVVHWTGITYTLQELCTRN